MSRQELALLIGSGLGLALWFAAPGIAGQPVPWDGGLRYLAALAVAGAAVELIRPGGVWPASLGVFAGQALALLFQIIMKQGPREPWPVTFQLLFVASMSLAAAMGSVTVAAFFAWLRPSAPGADAGAMASRSNRQKQL